MTIKLMALAAMTCALSAGCVIAPVDVDPISDLPLQPEDGGPFGTGNGFTKEIYMEADWEQAGSVPLASRYSNGSFVLNTADPYINSLRNDPSGHGRKILKYAIRVAAPAGVDVIINLNLNGPHDIESGALGLAPEWVMSPYPGQALTDTHHQEHVTAGLIEMVNQFEIPMVFVTDQTHGAIPPGLTPDTTAWGNEFIYRGETWVCSAGVLGRGEAEDRWCVNQIGCVAEYVGECTTHDLTDVCYTDVNGYIGPTYTRCKDPTDSSPWSYQLVTSLQP